MPSAALPARRRVPGMHFGTMRHRAIFRGHERSLRGATIRSSPTWSRSPRGLERMNERSAGGAPVIQRLCATSRGTMLRVALEINFAAWGMIACAAVKLAHWLSLKSKLAILRGMAPVLQLGPMLRLLIRTFPHLLAAAKSQAGRGRPPAPATARRAGASRHRAPATGPQLVPSPASAKPATVSGLKR